MSINKLALMRYKIIDDCLRNRRRKWTLEDLVEKVSDVLYQTEGIEGGVSKRTLQADIQLMRSDKLGYNAPIVVNERKYYTYDDEAYSIVQATIKPADVEKMQDIVRFLRQMKGFAYFGDMSDLIARLENSLYRSAHQGSNVLQMEGNEQLKGLGYIQPLYQAIVRKTVLRITYKSFKTAEAREGLYYPYLLKEYRNRWFLIACAQPTSSLLTLALDRIEACTGEPGVSYREYQGADLDHYYDNVIGVTKTEKDRTQKVVLCFDKANAPYVLTKPLHPSQKVLEHTIEGVVIQIDVVLNFELEREIIGFGDGVKVLAPRLLVSHIRKRLASAAAQYALANSPSHVPPTNSSPPQ